MPLIFTIICTIIAFFVFAVITWRVKETFSDYEILKTEKKAEEEALKIAQNAYLLARQEAENICGQINQLKDEHIAKLTELRQFEQECKQKEDKLANELQDSLKMYDELCEEQEKRLQEVSSDFMEEWRKSSSELTKERQELEEQINSYKSIADAAVEAAKRAQLDADAKNFYRIILPQDAKHDIALLRQIEPTLAHPEAINKVIWKLYYENPVSDMIGRVVGKEQKTGIYKITNTENGMAYVGQAVSIADRWRQHIKRGIGADTPTQNKFYPAMKQFGPESFTFEILEECSRDELNERERFFIDFFKTKEYGFNVKAGVLDGRAN